MSICRRIRRCVTSVTLVVVAALTTSVAPAHAAPTQTATAPYADGAAQFRCINFNGTDDACQSSAAADSATGHNALVVRFDADAEPDAGYHVVGDGVTGLTASGFRVKRRTSQLVVDAVVRVDGAAVTDTVSPASRVTYGAQVLGYLWRDDDVDCNCDAALSMGSLVLFCKNTGQCPRSVQGPVDPGKYHVRFTVTGHDGGAITPGSYNVDIATLAQFEVNGGSSVLDTGLLPSRTTGLFEMGYDYTVESVSVTG